MLLNFFYTLRDFKVPVSISELMDLYSVMDKGVVFANINDFYSICRSVLVKDEKYYDRFDQAFGKYFEGVEAIETDWLDKAIPEEWLRKKIERMMKEGAIDEMEKYGNLQELLEKFKERLHEQHDRHQGGNKWIGTGGTSAFGGYGEHPEGVRVTEHGQNNRAAKVWANRRYRDLDEHSQLDNRNMKMALRRLRHLTREGQPEEFDIDGTIKATAQQGGMLDVQMQASKRNHIKVLVFFDIGGSMDPYIKMSEELFAALKSQVKHLKYYYFHNFFYETVWKSNARRHAERISLYDVLHTYSSDYKVIIVGDAAMSPYEIQSVGGSVEHWNEEPGFVWWERLNNHFDKVVWINPEQKAYWGYTQTVQWIKEMVQNEMHPLTLNGIEEACKSLVK